MKEIRYSELNYYGTKVSISRTQEKIKKILKKFGLQGHRFTEYKNIGIIEFILRKNNNEMAYRFKFKLPEKENHKKQVYRALLHYLKNRFLAIEFGITTIEKEFLQELVLKLPDQTTITVKELVENQLSELEFKSELYLPFNKKKE